MSNTVELCQSLIQKAVRRGDAEMTRRVVAYLIHSGNFDWVRKRLAVLVFEECWTYGTLVSFENNEKTLLEQILRLASTVKNRNAAGLGSLVYNLSIGDQSVLESNPNDEHIRIITKALSEPQSFWKSCQSRNTNHIQKEVLDNAQLAYGMADAPWDKAFTLAAAYLSVSSPIPETKFVTTKSEIPFPLWVAIDMHTSEGASAIQIAAKQIGFDPEKALWLTFYLEGVRCNMIEFSPWWEREKIWRMKSLGLTMEETNEIWERLKSVLIDLLKDKAEKLSMDLGEEYDPVNKISS